MTSEGKTKLFGLHKGTVDTFLRKLDQSYKDELFQLQREIEELSKVNTELERTQASLQADRYKQNASDVLTKAGAGLPSILGAIHAQVAKETDDIRLKSKEELQELDQSIHKIKGNIQKGTRLIETFIQQFSKGIEDLGQLPETLLLDNEFVLASRNGETIEGSPPLKDQEFMDQIEEPQFAGFSSFWEGSERVLAQALPRVTIGKERSMNQKPDLQTSSLLEGDEGSNAQPRNQVQPKEVPPPYESPPTPSRVSPAPNEENPEPSEGIKQEIDLIKRRYIVGKVAGSRLYDLSGNLIVEKGQPITDEMVDQANLTGQLSDLIVHMRIPGLGE